MPHEGIALGPCSPKSIYCLTNKVRLAAPLDDVAVNISFAQVGLTGLGDAAFNCIQSQLSENNIMQELFSPFTAKYVMPQLGRFVLLR